MSALTEFVARPDNGGTEGRFIKVSTNVFPLLEVFEKPIYQYDVVITPEMSVEDMKKVWIEFERELKRGVGSDIFMAFDGKKNAYSSESIEKRSIEVSIDRNSGSMCDYPPLSPPSFGQSRGGNFGGRGGGMRRGGRNYQSVGARGGYRNEGHSDHGASYQDSQTKRGYCPGKFAPDIRSVKVLIKPSASPDMLSLKKFVKKQGPESDDCLHAVSSITALLRHLPSFKFVSLGQNLYSPSERTAITGGLEIWRGYHQSIKVMRAGHLGVNIDIAATVFKRGNAKLLDLIMEILKISTPSELLRVRDLKSKISSEFKGSSVIMTHVPGKKIRFKITGVSPLSASAFKFEGPSGTTTVEKYFQNQYGVTLEYPDLPLMLKGKDSAVPIELLTMAPSQRFMKRLAPDQVSEMIRCTVVRPRDRAEAIGRAASSHLGLVNNPYLKSVGYKFDPRPMTIPARVISAPAVVFSDGKKVNGTDGYWRLQGQVARPMKLHSFAFLFFVNINREESYDITRAIIKACKNIGIRMPNSESCPIVCRQPRDPMEVKRAIRDALSDAHNTFKMDCQLVFCVLKKGAKIGYTGIPLYEEIKRTTLTELDVLSQCLLVDKVARGRVNPQYSENLAIKVNIKLGGATNMVDHMPLFDTPTQLYGADVTHSHPGSIAPSVAAVVSTVDPGATRYYTYLRAQPSRQEIISDLESMASQSLEMFKKHNNCYPSRIIFFRDGVSSGQFREVKRSEVAALQKALEKVNHLDKTKITFVIVQKRHHVRFFPVSDNESDRSGNSMPGTVVDDTITHPIEFNFYLQSHAGIQGTSKPTLYHVIHDESGIGSDEFQKLCYNLCFLSERASRSVSMVSPAYRAHIAAFMGRLFIDSDADLSDTQSSSTQRDREITVGLRPIKKLMEENTMYYM